LSYVFTSEPPPILSKGSARGIKNEKLKMKNVACCGPFVAAEKRKVRHEAYSLRGELPTKITI